MDSLINQNLFRRSLGLAVSAISLYFTFISCESAEESVFKAGSSQQKPNPELLTGKEGRGLGATSSTPEEVASATYGIRVKSQSGAQLCEGEVSLQIMSDFSIKFPATEVRCLSLKIDLAGILASVGSGSLSNSIESNGKYISIKSIAGADFTPPRPVLLGPIVQDTKIFEKFKSVTDHAVVSKDFTSGKQLSAKGSFVIEVLNPKTTYSNKYLSEPFTNILHWQITTKGFEGIPPQNGLLFKKIEWLFNTRPIMIPQINITGDLTGFLQEDGQEGGVGSLVGDLEVSLVVKKHKTN